jgi:hypothetical protein
MDEKDRTFFESLLQKYAQQSERQFDALSGQIERVEVELRQEIGRVEVELKEEIGRVEVELRQEIGRVEIELKQEIGNVERKLEAKIVQSEQRTAALIEGLDHKIDLLADGHQMLYQRMDRMEAELKLEIGKVDRRVTVLASDFAAHSADSDAHLRGYKFKEEDEKYE